MNGESKHKLQRDWAKRDHYNDLMNLCREHDGYSGADIDNCDTMIHKAPAARNVTS